MEIIAQCWRCTKVYNISKWDGDLTGVKCECDGYIITPSGKVLLNIVEIKSN